MRCFNSKLIKLTLNSALHADWKKSNLNHELIKTGLKKYNVK